MRGGSVNVRTKRREKRTKLLLRACGNIYPPFIVTPLFRNLKYIQRGPAPPPSSSSSLAYSPKHLAPFKRILCAQNERRRREMAQTKHGRTAESGGQNRGVNGRLMSCPRRPLFPASRERSGADPRWPRPPNHNNPKHGTHWPPAGGAVGAEFRRLPRLTHHNKRSGLRFTTQKHCAARHKTQILTIVQQEWRRHTLARSLE